MTFYLDVKRMIVTGSIDEMQLFVHVLVKFNMTFSENLALLLVYFISQLDKRRMNSVQWLLLNMNTWYMYMYVVLKCLNIFYEIEEMSLKLEKLFNNEI